MAIPRSSTIYDPFPAYRPPTGGGRRSRTNPYGLEDPTYNYLQALPYAPSPYTAGALRAGGEQDYAPLEPPQMAGPYTTGALRPSRSAAAFDYGEPTPEGPPPPDPFPYASGFDRDFYSGQNLAPPSAPPLVAPAAGAMAAAGAVDPTTALLQQLVSWQAVNQSNLEEQRRIQQQQFQQAREDQQRQQIIASFGSFGKAGAAPPIAGGSIAQSQAAARHQLDQQWQEAADYRNALANYDPNPAPVWVSSGQPLSPYPPQGKGGQDIVGGPPLPQMGGAWVKPPPSGPPPRMPVRNDPGGAQGTMLGNAAFGIHVSRDGVRPEGGGANANSEFARLQRMAGDTSPEGTANWEVYQQHVLENSPQAELLKRGEEGGNLTPAERAYLMAMRLRRNRQT